MADEGGMQNFHKDSDEGALNPKAIFFKGAEILLGLIIISLIIWPMESFYNSFMSPPQLSVFGASFIFVTLVSYVIINAILVLGFFLGDRIPKVTVLLFTVVAVLLHVVAASLMIANWKKFTGSLAVIYNYHVYGSALYLRMLMGAAVLTYVDAILYGVDIFFTIKYF